MKLLGTYWLPETPTVQHLCAICFHGGWGVGVCVQECEQRWEGGVGVRMDPCQLINEDTSDCITDISTTYT